VIFCHRIKIKIAVSEELGVPVKEFYTQAQNGFVYIYVYTV
jgi:hypothetical protein